MASIYKRNDIKSSKWYIAYKDEHNKPRVRVGFTDKKQTQRLAAELEENARLIREGLSDPGEQRLKEHRARELAEHLQEYSRVIENRSSDAKHVQATMTYIKTLIVQLEWSKLSHIDGSAFEQQLSEMREEFDWSPRTYNAYLVAFRGFTRWLARTGRCSVDPLAAISQMPVHGDVRRRRRELTDEQIARLLSAASSGPVRLKVSGPDRAMLYEFLLATGIRFSEAMSLTVASLELEHPDGPRVRVNAGYSKRRRIDFQPITLELASRLRAWVVGRKPEKPLWRKISKACEQWLQPDLAAAGVDYIDHNGEYADFHALRHTFISRLNRGGVPISTAMNLARHSDPTLTLKTYGHVSTDDRKAGVETAAFRGPKPALQEASEPPARKRIRKCAEPTASHSAAQARTPKGSQGTRPEREAIVDKSLNSSRFRTGSHEDARPCTGEKENAPRWTRTINPLIKSQLLCQLS
jgi:integrase